MSNKVKNVIKNNKVNNGNISISTTGDVFLSETSDEDKTDSIYHESYLQETDISPIKQGEKIDTLLSIIASALTIFTAFNFTEYHFLTYPMIIFGLIAFYCVIRLYQHFSFLNNLKRKNHAYIDGKLYLFSEATHSIYAVIPPKCPICKAEKKQMQCQIDFGTLSTDCNTIVNCITKIGEQDDIYFICPKNKEHRIKIDWTQYVFPTDESHKKE